MSWIIDQIPWWVYVVTVTVIVGALFSFYSPILVPIWNLTPRWVKVAGGAILAVGLAFVAGRNRGAKDATEMQKKNDAAAEQTRRDVDESVASSKPVDIDKRLDRWMRDDK